MEESSTLEASIERKTKAYGPDIMGKTVVLFSGGLDSTTLLYHAIELHGVENVTALSFDYGQRHNKELDAAIAIAADLEVRHITADLTAINVLIRRGSQAGNEQVPEGRYDDESMKATIVPNRNMIMLSIAAGHAAIIDALSVYYGAHQGDHAIYPDCRPEFVGALAEAIGLGNLWENEGRSVRLLAPFVDIDKTAIVKLGVDLGVPFEMTWSCYKGGRMHCGKCGTCQERKEAFELAHVEDPTVYAE